MQLAAFSRYEINLNAERKIMNETSTSVSVDSSPQRSPIYGPTRFLTAMPCLFIAVYLAFVIFFIVMAWKFVKAHEKIANALENGIKIKKDGIDV